MGQGQIRGIEISGLWTFVLPFSVRHQFVNDAYDNVEGMGTTQNGTSQEYAQPVISNEARFPTQTLPGQDNGALFLGKTLLLSQLVTLRCLFVRLLRGCLCKNHPLNFASKIILPETLVTERLHQGKNKTRFGWNGNGFLGALVAIKYSAWSAPVATSPKA